jgi:integrase
MGANPLLVDTMALISLAGQGGDSSLAPDDGWGELILTASEPGSGTSRTDSGSARQRRELEHRPTGETRPALHPELVVLLSQHLKNFPPGPDGRIFTGRRGGIFNDRAYLKIFHRAPAAAFTPRESASLLTRRPCDLRHAAVSTWLDAGVPAQLALAHTRVVISLC